MLSPEARWWGRILEPLYALGSGLFHGLHDRELISRAELPVPVISVGNLTVGGTGKTPTVLELCRAARSCGFRPAILTRGYRGRSRGVLRGGAWPSGPATAGEAGDEALLLSRALQGVPVVVGKDRARGARSLLSRGERVDLFVLDDGFQHRRLQRDRDLVLIDVRDPVGNGHLLPAGTLRESPRGLGRADRVLATGGTRSHPVPPPLRDILGNVPATRAWYRPTGIRSLSPEGPPAEPLAGREVVAVAGIARPERFWDLLAGQGALIRRAIRRPDHHRYTPTEVRDLERMAKREGVSLVTTTKDAVRLEGLVDPSGKWVVQEVMLEVEGGWVDLLVQLTRDLLPGIAEP